MAPPWPGARAASPRGIAGIDRATASTGRPLKEMKPRQAQMARSKTQAKRSPAPPRATALLPLVLALASGVAAAGASVCAKLAADASPANGAPYRLLCAWLVPGDGAQLCRLPVSGATPELRAAWAAAEGLASYRWVGAADLRYCPSPNSSPDFSS
jgi:hypothetical protein